MGPLLTSKHFWPQEFSICWALRMDSDFLLFVLYQGTRGTTSFKTHFWASRWGASPEPPPACKGTASHHSKRELFTLVRQFWCLTFPLKALKGLSFPRCTDPWSLSNTGNQGKFTIVCNSVFLSTGGNATLGFERGKKRLSWLCSQQVHPTAFYWWESRDNSPCLTSTFPRRYFA